MQTWAQIRKSLALLEDIASLPEFVTSGHQRSVSLPSSITNDHVTKRNRLSLPYNPASQRDDEKIIHDPPARQLQIDQIYRVRHPASQVGDSEKIINNQSSTERQTAQSSLHGDSVSKIVSHKVDAQETSPSKLPPTLSNKLYLHPTSEVAADKDLYDARRMTAKLPLLPLEIQFEILRLGLTTSRPIINGLPRAPPSSLPSAGNDKYKWAADLNPALLRLNKTLHAEAMRLLYECNAFAFGLYAPEYDASPRDHLSQFLTQKLVIYQSDGTADRTMVCDKLKKVVLGHLDYIGVRKERVYKSFFSARFVAELIRVIDCTKTVPVTVVIGKTSFEGVNAISFAYDRKVSEMSTPEMVASYPRKELRRKVKQVVIRDPCFGKIIVNPSKELTDTMKMYLMAEEMEGMDIVHVGLQTDERYDELDENHSDDGWEDIEQDS